MSGMFYRFSTAGNTTLFVDRPELLPKALASIPAEQAASFNLESSSLEMAGGEFCLNACLAFAALQKYFNIIPSCAHIAEQTCKIFAEGTIPCWQTGIVFEIGSIRINVYNDVTVVHLPGISHALINCDTLPGHAAAFENAKIMREKYNLNTLPAAGIIWWRQKNREMELLPVISVPQARTICIEGACGSASLALATALGEGEYHIRQQSGSKLQVNISKDMAVVEAQTRLLARGDLWLP